MCRLIMDRTEVVFGRLPGGKAHRELKLRFEIDAELEVIVLQVSKKEADLVLRDGTEVILPLTSIHVEQACGDCDGFAAFASEALPASEPREGTIDEELERARGMVERILASEGERVLGVIWFGSRVRGTHESDSDCDLLVIARDPVEDWIGEGDRLTNDLKRHYPIRPDVHVYSASFFATCMAEDGLYLGHEAVRTGITLYRGASDEEPDSSCGRPAPAALPVDPGHQHAQ